MAYSTSSEANLEGGVGGVSLTLFCNHLFFLFVFFFFWFFCDLFEELQTVLIKVKLIINNASILSNTIKTYLTLNYLLFSRELLCCSNTTSTAVRNLTIFSNTTGKINRISNHFWHRWRHKYVVNLCETKRASKLNIDSQKIMSC